MLTEFPTKELFAIFNGLIQSNEPNVLNNDETNQYNDKDALKETLNQYFRKYIVNKSIGRKQWLFSVNRFLYQICYKIHILPS